MNPITIAPLVKNGVGRYQLVMAASKRATQLAAGEPALVPSRAKKLSTLALEEIAQGKVKVMPRKKADKAADALEPPVTL